MNWSQEDTQNFLSKLLSGSVSALTRLSGGASRVTYSFVLQQEGSPTRQLILQQYRSDGVGRPGQSRVEADLMASAHSLGVPVPHVVAVGDRRNDVPAYVIVERLDGDSIPRRILRRLDTPEAQQRLTQQCARALSAIHRIDPESISNLSSSDPLRHPLPFLDNTGEIRPVLELAARWLQRHQPEPAGDVTVHGDFRMGNLLVNDDGLTGVLDWELSHRGDPAEDIGWLCARAWRFGGNGRVGGFGELTDFLNSYEQSGGVHVTPEQIQWWEAYALLKWAIICALQASAHLSGSTRSIELAAIGRRVCESEWDLLRLLGAAPALNDFAPNVKSEHSLDAPFGRPTSSELLAATIEYVETTMIQRSEGAEKFEARVARNVLGMVQREVLLSSQIRLAHESRLKHLGFNSDRDLAAALRSGVCDERLEEIAKVLCGSARDQLLVSHPEHLVE